MDIRDVPDRLISDLNAALLSIIEKHGYTLGDDIVFEPRTNKRTPTISIDIKLRQLGKKEV